VKHKSLFKRQITFTISTKFNPAEIKTAVLWADLAGTAIAYQGGSQPMF
jgi:hypothetical protein